MYTGTRLTSGTSTWASMWTISWPPYTWPFRSSRTDSGAFTRAFSFTSGAGLASGVATSSSSSFPSVLFTTTSASGVGWQAVRRRAKEKVAQKEKLTNH